MKDRVKQVIAATFGTDVDQVPADAAVDRFELWNSLGHLDLMLALEAEFGIHIPAETMLELMSLESIEQYLSQQVVRN